MRPVNSAVGVGLLAGALLSAPLGAQSTGQAPQTTFRSAANLVEVDVIVHDPEGRFVAGLTSDDFEVYEDGERQDVQQFYLVSHEGGALRTVNALPTASSPEDPRNRRLFVFLFDEQHLSNESLLRIKTGIERFIRSQFQAGDYGGIFTAGSMYRGRITSDKVELLAGLQSVRPAFDTRDRLLLELRDFPVIPGENDALRIDYGDQTLLDSLAEQACEVDTTFCAITGGLDQVEFQLEQKARRYIRQARVATANTLEQLRYVAARLGSIPGRKTVIFLSDGFFVEEDRSQVQSIAAIAARSGATFYSVYGRGTSIVGGHVEADVLAPRQSRSATFDSVDDGPAILTGSTGGFVVRASNDISRAIGLVARDTSAYYVLGYQPTNAEMDGKVRRIEVRPTADDLNVRARKAYVASPLPPMENLRGGGRGR
jgi:VWFA-related protein